MIRFAFATNLIVVLLAGSAFPQETELYRVGIPKSAFREVPAPLRAFAGQPFQDLVKQQTGLKAEMIQEEDPLVVAQKLNEGKFQLAVLQGHEFAWAKEKYPNLEPLIVSVYRPKEVQAVMIVRHDCKADGPAALKGGKLAVSYSLKDHARLFLEKQRQEEMEGSNFCSIEKTTTVHDAIHKVKDNEVDVTVADIADWAHYQRLYPGASQNLKVLAKSDVFPNTVLLYKKDGLNEEVKKKFLSGFLSAHEVPKAAKMMSMIRIERFAEIPNDYEVSVRTCFKSYPKPLAEK